MWKLLPLPEHTPSAERKKKKNLNDLNKTNRKEIKGHLTTLQYKKGDCFSLILRNSQKKKSYIHIYYTVYVRTRILNIYLKKKKKVYLHFLE